MQRCFVALALSCLGGIGPGSLAAQSVVARRDVNVRAGQSRGFAIVGVLAAGDSATLILASPVRGYYRLRTAAGVSGWSYGRYLRILSGSPASGHPPAPAAVAAAVDSTWPKPAPDTRPFNRGALGVCGPDGRGGDQPTNHLKNRIDEPASYHAVTFDAVARLPYPPNHLQRRDQWRPADLAVIAPYEGRGVSVIGFVAGERGVIVEDARASPSGEATNCEALDDAGVDWHVTLVKRQGDPKSAGIVVEVTPRVRANGHPWTPASLTAAAAAGDSVRISGWLMYDPEHFAETTGYDPGRPSRAPAVRATLWEIHPVTRIEVFDRATGRWRTLP